MDTIFKNMNRNEIKTILEIGSPNIEKSKELYDVFPNAEIRIEKTHEILKEQIKENFKDRMLEKEVDIYDLCYLHEMDVDVLADIERSSKIYANKNNVLLNTIETSIEMFCVYHKKYYFRRDNFYFKFIGVNEIYEKEKNKRNILEYELEKYDPFLQKRGYMETSVYLHVYWNKLHVGKDMIGFSQYDMRHKQIYNNLNKSKIYILSNKEYIVRNGKWNKIMFPELRNLNYLIEHYNNHYKTNYSMKELEKMPFSAWQTNIYPIEIFAKLCGWLEKLVYDIYPWSNEPPYETHFGSIGGYTERALSLFNAFEIYEGKSYEFLNILHETLEIKEQYNHKSFLNNYNQDIYCRLVNDNISDYKVIGTEFKNGCIVRENNTTTQLFYIDDMGQKSKELMVISNKSILDNLKHIHNIINDDLSNYEIYYKEKSKDMYSIVVK